MNAVAAGTDVTNALPYKKQLVPVSRPTNALDAINEAREAELASDLALPIHKNDARTKKPGDHRPVADHIQACSIVGIQFTVRLFNRWRELTESPVFIEAYPKNSHGRCRRITSVGSHDSAQ
jgi:hypothetical protein